MKNHILQLLLAVGWLFFQTNGLGAQAYTGNSGGLIPGATSGFYCQNAAVSRANVPLNGRLGTHYVLDSVVLRIAHELPAELQLSLVSPRGNLLSLSIANGGSLDAAYGRIRFADTGTAISSATPPFTSTYRPQGGTFAAQFAGERLNGEWQLEVCDLANNANGGVINGFTLYFRQIATPTAEPIYQISASSTNNINVNLNEDCQRLLLPSMMLNGDFDADRDGNRPPDEAYRIVVNDANPCNGPIIDGCGNFEVWIAAAPTTPSIQRRFVNCASGSNLRSFTTIPNPASGQTASVSITPDTVFLRTRGGNATTSALSAGFSYVFPEAGRAAFRLNLFTPPLQTGPLPLNVARVGFDGLPYPSGPGHHRPMALLPWLNHWPFKLEIRLVFELTDVDGFSSPASTPAAVAKVFDFFFSPRVADVGISGSLPLGGFVHATDGTPARFLTLPTPNTDLFVSQLNSVLVTNLPANVSRSYRVNGRSGAVIGNSLNSQLMARLQAGGGLPQVFDGCSDVIVTVFDQVTSGGNCENTVVTRTFIAQDVSSCGNPEGPNPSAMATVQLVFRQASLANILPPQPVLEIDCANYQEAGNPVPIAVNYPGLTTATGIIYLDQPFSNLAV
ncbi:MAG: hypothetical protein HC821_05350, partial [Lewinella sp.]|nr:hypothetical protein [Lewinella sp.]